MARYALAEHVFVCVNGEHLVLLDLKEDRYWALEASQTAGLGPLVVGWPVKTMPSTEEAGSPSPETMYTLSNGSCSTNFRITANMMSQSTFPFFSPLRADECSRNERMNPAFCKLS